MLSQFKLMQGWIYGGQWKPLHLQLNSVISFAFFMVSSIPLLDRRPPERAAGADQREAGPGAADRGPAR